jgi:hypothetical protein
MILTLPHTKACASSNVGYFDDSRYDAWAARYYSGSANNLSILLAQVSTLEKWYRPFRPQVNRGATIL